MGYLFLSKGVLYMSGVVAYVGIIGAFSVVAIGLYYGFRALKLL